jgi:hypothetical protein
VIETVLVEVPVDPIDPSVPVPGREKRNRKETKKRRRKKIDLGKAKKMEQKLKNLRKNHR